MADRQTVNLPSTNCAVLGSRPCYKGFAEVFLPPPHRLKNISIWNPRALIGLLVVQYNGYYLSSLLKKDDLFLSISVRSTLPPPTKKMELVSSFWNHVLFCFVGWSNYSASNSMTRGWLQSTPSIKTVVSKPFITLLYQAGTNVRIGCLFVSTHVKN